MRRNKMQKKPLFTFLVLILILALALLYFVSGRPALQGLFQSGEYGASLELDTSFVYAAQKYTGGVAVFGKEGIVGISNLGKQVWEVDFPVTDPILSCSGGYVLAAERGGQTLRLLSGGKVRQEMEMENDIISASVNRKGTFAVVTKERGYKGCVQVFSKRGKPLFKWHSAEQNILSAVVSEDNKKLAVSVVNMTDLSRMCTVLQFDMRETSPQVLEVGNENLVANLQYNGNELICIGDEALYCFKNNGTEKFHMDYAGRKLQMYSFYPGSLLTLGFWSGEQDGGSVVEFYDTNGRKRGGHTVYGALAGLDIYGKFAVVTTAEEIMVLGANGKVKLQKEEEHGMQKAFLCGNRNRVFLLSGNLGSMYIF